MWFLIKYMLKMSVNSNYLLKLLLEHNKIHKSVPRHNSDMGEMFDQKIVVRR